MNAKLYETDFNLWLKEQVEILSKKDFENLDLDNLIVEIQGIQKEWKREICDYFDDLILNIIKFKETNSKEYRGTAFSFKNRIDDMLEYSPSLIDELTKYANSDFTWKSVYLHIEYDLNVKIENHQRFDLKDLLSEDFYSDQ